MKDYYIKNEEGRYIIPIKLNSYEDVYDELDFRDNEYRKLNMNIHDFIKDVYEEIAWSEDLEILFVLPETIRSHEKEKKVTRSFESYYERKIKFKKRKAKTAGFRILKYLGIAAISLILWVILSKTSETKIIQELLNIIATVLLWQVVSMIFVESSILKLSKDITEKIYGSKISFTYIKEN